MLSAPLACLETSCISFSFLFRVKMPRLVLSLSQRPFCAVGKLGKRKCGRRGEKVGEGGVGEARTRILRSRHHHWLPCEMTTSFREEAVGGVAKCHLVSQATESSDSRKSVVFTGYIPLRRIEPTFEFARKIRSFCQFLQSKTIKIEPII